MELEMLTGIVAEVLKVDPREVKGATTFVEDLGADSLDILRIVMRVEEVFNIILPRENIANILTVDDVIKLISKIKKD